MNQIITQGIVLSRTDFQEADRILNILSPDQGKLKVIAKGARKPKSKLAGGIELLSVNDITFLPGRGEISTLVSSRMKTHFGNIVSDINRTMLAYELLKKTNRVTEDAAELEYFELLKSTLEGLDDSELSSELVELWFAVQLLQIAGHIPNLKTDFQGVSLEADKTYLFDFDQMAFTRKPNAPFAANHLKLLRLAAASETPVRLKQVKDAALFVPETLSLAQNILRQHVRI